MNNLIANHFQNLKDAIVLGITSKIEEHTNNHSEGNTACTARNGTFTFGHRLVVDVDIFSAPNTDLNIRLNDVPIGLSFGDNHFILAGVVARVNRNHFVSITRRANGQWELIDDLAKHPRSCTASSKVSPVILFYVRLTSN